MLLFIFLFISVIILYLGVLFFNINSYILGVIIASYFLTQFLFSICNYRKCISISNNYTKSFPKIALNVVGYRENPIFWQNCLSSIRDNEYPSDLISCICVMIDGNETDDEYMKQIFHDIFIEQNTNIYCELLEHKGKRHAMYSGFKYIQSNYPDNQYILVIDSDTIILKQSIIEIVKLIDENDKNGCATGSLEIFNQNTFLTKIVHSRYGYAFDIERGAMSYMGCMNCCSGPFSIYRQNILDNILLTDFTEQKYCNYLVGPGDDRHLTNLILNKGYRSLQTPLAIALTESPETFFRFLQQQLRWMRSFYREQIWQIKALHKQSFYLTFITIYEMLFPFFILTTSIYHFYFLNKTNLFFHRLLYAGSILFLRTILLFLFKQCKFIYFYHVFYFPLYFLFLLPLKFYAIFTLNRMSWITSDRKNIISVVSIDKFCIFLFVSLWNLFLAYSLYNSILFF